MKRLVLLFVSISMILSITIPGKAQLKIKEGDELYVKPNSENLRLSPAGSVICQLPQGTRLIAIEEQGNWVAVHLVGYIWKSSLSTNRFDIPGFTIRALHILVKTEEEALAVKKMLDGGSDFSQLAKERSIGPTAQKGGDLGIITKGDLMPELDQAINSLSVGKISDIVKTEAGFNIFKRIE